MHGPVIERSGAADRGWPRTARGGLYEADERYRSQGRLRRPWPAARPSRRGHAPAQRPSRGGRGGLAAFRPMVLLIFVAGHAADRFDRRRIAATCQLVEMV